ncbi:hypothetical protein Tco_1243567 [Tanacetum coccineum]
MVKAQQCDLERVMEIECKAVENVIENESHFSLEVVDDDLSSLAMSTKHFMSGSMFRVGEGKDESMGRMGGGGEDNGGGVDLGVSKRLSLLLVGDTCGIEVWEVGGDPDTWSDGGERGESVGAVRRRAPA